MNNRKVRRLLEAYSRECGLAPVAWEHGGKHVRLVLAVPGGRTAKIFMSSSPSDGMAYKAVMRDIKKLATALISPQS